MTLQALAVGDKTSPEAVVFLHGVGSDATVWTEQLSAIDSVALRLAFDMPGYRGSPSHPTQDAADLGRLVLASIPAGVRRVHLVGLSLGAVVAAHATVQAPHRIASLTLASGFLTYPNGAAVAATARQAAALGMPALAAARIDRILASPAQKATVVATMSAIPVAAYQRMSRAVWTADLAPIAPSLRAPTLVLTGSLDPVTPPALGRGLAAAIPGARFALVPEASHLINVDAPTRFNALVAQQIQAVLA